MTVLKKSKKGQKKKKAKKKRNEIALSVEIETK